MNVDDHSLLDPAIQESPYDYYAALREQAPVYRMPDLGAYLVTRYRDVKNVIAHPEIWSIDLVRYTGSSMFQHREALEVFEREGYPRNTKLSTDPPEHRSYRGIVEASFSAGRVRALGGFVQRCVDELTEEMARAGAVEFQQAFGWRLPIRVISKLLGVPIEDAPRIKAWSDIWLEPLGYGLSKQREIEVAKSGVELQRYLDSQFERKRREPGEDILTDLVQARLPDGSPLPAADRMGLAEHIIVGGHETLTSALAAGMLLLVENPGVEAELRSEPALIRNFVEEVLRLESPSQGFFRYALRDAQLAGVTIPKGSMVHLRFGAANRDPDQFPDPDVLDLRRPNAGSHMAFSQGEHHCLGAPLARLELQTAFATLLRHFDHFELTPGKQRPGHVPGLSLRSLRDLHLTLTPRRGER